VQKEKIKKEKNSSHKLPKLQLTNFWFQGDFFNFLKLTIFQGDLEVKNNIFSNILAYN
jgi:hypothetical protein